MNAENILGVFRRFREIEISAPSLSSLSNILPVGRGPGRSQKVLDMLAPLLASGTIVEDHRADYLERHFRENIPMDAAESVGHLEAAVEYAMANDRAETRRRSEEVESAVRYGMEHFV